MPVRLSLIIPAYNEASRIGNTLRDCLDYFARQDYDFEIIVVDDGSHDGTSELVRREFPNVRLISYAPNRGKGYAVKQGMLEAQGQYRLFYDADGSTPISEVDKLWVPLSAGADVVIGSRSSPGSQV
ncbi:MAG TPA: glycosyltransferase, partial [Candidatus Bathyarchaeia archaeon]|nr:glycosyltransferase [Candidatus Bathyarchaeia archaeon]